VYNKKVTGKPNLTVPACRAKQKAVKRDSVFGGKDK